MNPTVNSTSPPGPFAATDHVRRKQRSERMARVFLGGMAVAMGVPRVVIVTHNMAQARPVSDECIYMLLGELIEHSRTEELFLNPKHPQTADYIEGRYG